MKKVRVAICLVAIVSALGNAFWAGEVPETTAEAIRNGSMLVGGLVGLVAGPLLIPIPEDTPLSERLLVTIPVTAATVASSVMVARWIADTTMAVEPTLLLSPVLGAGLGLAGGALVGAIGFPLAVLLAVPTVNVPEGYWGDMTPLQTVGMGLLAGGFWGGVTGLPVGALSSFLISLVMGF